MTAVQPSNPVTAEELMELASRLRSISEPVNSVVSGPKPGVKTTEFWLTLLVNVLSAMLSSGLVIESTPAGQMIAAVAAGLTSVGYVTSRAFVKGRTPA